MTSAQTTRDAIVLRGLCRRFGGITAVRDVDLDVAHGERRAILGPNGAGKTTLFNLIAGDLPASEGSVELLGRDVTRSPLHRRVGMGVSRTYQHSNLFDGLTALDTVLLAVMGPEEGHFAVRSGKEQRTRRIDAALTVIARVRLSGREDVLVAELSHGERRQLELAVALASDPKVVLLDEPAAGLSAGERQMLTDLLLGLDRDMTVVLIEHDMDIALTVAERVTVMADGVIVMEGNPDEVRASAEVQRIYLGAAADV